MIVSGVRTPITRSWDGGFNLTHPASLAGTVVRAAVGRAGIDESMIDDVVLGCANPEGAAGNNIGRIAALAAGLPPSVGGYTVNRFCGSGLQSIANAAHRIITNECDVVIAGGVESISAVQDNMNSAFAVDVAVARRHPAVYSSMLQTAEVVAQRYGISREKQDEFALMSQQRTARAIASGWFDEELMAIEVTSAVREEEGTLSIQKRIIMQDECPRPHSSAEGLARLRPVLPGGTVTPASASPFADGAAAVVMMDEGEASRQDRTILARFAGFAVAGCEPDEMGVGPVYAVPKLLSRAGLSAEDIDIWELNEAFASQVLYCRDTLGIDPERLNVNGGAIALGHPYGMSGTRIALHSILEGRRRGARWAVATMCIGGGQGAAALFEIAPV